MLEQKKPRRYASRLREQQAAATRERVVRAAADLFAVGGYAGTSLPQIARAAGVSTETVQAHGPKVQLLFAAIDLMAFSTRGEMGVLESEMGAELRAATTPDEALHAGAKVLTSINRGSHGLWLAVSEAARTDDDLAAAFRSLVLGLRVENRKIMDLWRERGWLRTDVGDEELARWSEVIGSVEVYDRVVRVEGATEDEYQALITRLLSELLPAR